MFFRGANSIEGRVRGFFEKILSPIRTKLAVSYRIGCVKFRHRESSAHRPHLLVWEPKIAKNLSFFGFL
jgi:hypothetical protein